MSTPPGFHQAMRGLDGFDHGIFDNADFWRYEDADQFDPGGMLNGVGCMCGDLGCDCGIGEVKASPVVEKIVVPAIYIAVGVIVGKFIL